MTLMQQGAPQALPRTVRLLVLAALALLVSSCAAPPPPQPPPGPPGASWGYSGDALFAPASYTRAHVYSRLRQHHKSPWDSTWYTVPAATTWESITAYYAAALGPDWTADARYPEDGNFADYATAQNRDLDRHFGVDRPPYLKDKAGYRLQVWSDGDWVLAIALNTGDPGTEQVLNVLVSDDDRQRGGTDWGVLDAPAASPAGTGVPGAGS